MIGRYEGKFEGFGEESERFGSPRARNERKSDKEYGNLVEHHHDKDFNNPLGKNPSDFWNITTRGFKGAHFAVYPEQLCIRPIKSSCPPNGIVLDLMCGSGTTLVVAKKLGRKYIGIDLNPKYVEIARKRLSTVPEKLETFMGEVLGV